MVDSSKRMMKQTNYWTTIFQKNKIGNLKGVTNRKNSKSVEKIYVQV